MRRSAAVLLFFLLPTGSAHADCTRTACTTAVPEPAPGVDPLLVRPTLTGATAAISTKEKNTTFKATVVPSQFIDEDHGWAFNELRFVVQTDTSSSLTRLAVSTGYNPFSRRSPRVVRILREMNTIEACGDTLNQALGIAELAQQAAYTKAASEHLADIVAADDAYEKSLAAASGQARQNSDALAARITAYTDANDKLTKARAKADAQHEKATAAAKKAQITCVHQREAREWSVINATWTPAVTLTASYDVFPFGHQPDPTTMTQETRLEWHGGPMVQLSLEERPSEGLNAQAWASIKRVRPTGDSGVKRATSYGGGLTVSYLAVSLLPAVLHRLPTSYLKDGFLPGIGVGTSLQIVECTDEASCVKGRTSQRSVTPYLDVLLSAALQFRIALPITYYDAVDKNGSEIASTFSIAGTIGSP